LPGGLDSGVVDSGVLDSGANESLSGQGERFAGPSLDLIFNDPLMVYTGHKAKVAGRGGFANDDRNVMLVVSNPTLQAATFTSPVETRQIAPTVFGG